jgi:hypothetical protein
MKSLFVLCLLIISLHGCANVTPINNPKLHDGKWGDYNEDMGEQCASAAMAQGIKHGLSNLDIDSLFSQCLFDQGLTI